jgi:phage terminase Nu1 subunit (DNA packaging protein)
MTKQTHVSITARELASLTGLTERRLYQLSESGVIPKPKDGQWPRVETLRAMFAHYRQGGERKDDLREAQTRQANANAKRIELQNLTESEEWVRMAEVERLLTAEVVLPLRSRLLDLPSTLAVRCNPSTPETARTALLQWSDETLKVLREKLGTAPTPTTEAPK